MRSKVIYVSGPLTQGDLLFNVRSAVAEGMQLRDVGYIPIIPHLSAFVELMHPRPYEYWMQWDFALLDVCDTVLRLDGDSPGGDREVQLALDLGKRVLYGYAGMSTLIAEATDCSCACGESDMDEDDDDITWVGGVKQSCDLEAEVELERWRSLCRRVTSGEHIRVSSIHSGGSGTVVEACAKPLAVYVLWDDEEQARTATCLYLEEIRVD